MNFILLEIKLWFKNDSSAPKSYFFEKNKVNVITGASSTGKSTIWRIVDYCLLSGITQIADKIANAVSWFGITFIINEQEISIARSSPEKSIVSQDVYFGLGPLPEMPSNNQTISQVKSHLNKLFNFSGELKQAYNNLLCYRHFLIFCSLTEKVIAQPDRYFDLHFFKDDFKNSTTGKMLNQIFELIIGADKPEIQDTKKARRRIEREIKKIKAYIQEGENKIKDFKDKVKFLIEESKNYNFIDLSQSFENEDKAILFIEQVISTAKNMAEGKCIFNEENEKLNQQKNDIELEIDKLNRYEREYNQYQKNLTKSADSLQPIEFLYNNLSNQLVQSYETQIFLQTLRDSFYTIKNNIKQQISPLDVSEDLKKFEEQLSNINKIIKEKNESSDKFQFNHTNYINIGNIEAKLRSILTAEEIKKIESELIDSSNRLKILNEQEKTLFSQSDTVQFESIKLENIKSFNKAAQEVYDWLNKGTEYKGYCIALNKENLILDIFPPNMPAILPISETGSQANYVFLHLCMFLGLHMHMAKMNLHYVPQIIFIDQPSTPFLSYKKDQEMLNTIFEVLNSFIDKMVIENKISFQIILTDHALPSDWNKLSNFKLVDEFVDGNALIPNESFYKNV